MSPYKPDYDALLVKTEKLQAVADAAWTYLLRGYEESEEYLKLATNFDRRHGTNPELLALYDALVAARGIPHASALLAEVEKPTVSQEVAFCHITGLYPGGTIAALRESGSILKAELERTRKERNAAQDWIVRMSRLIYRALQVPPQNANATHEMRLKLELALSTEDLAKMKEHAMNEQEIIHYEHHGRTMAVRQDLQGKHREHCLCYQCGVFSPGAADNCGIAQALYELDVSYNVVTPVWECAAFCEKENGDA
jgi:hypothetical protein